MTGDMAGRFSKALPRVNDCMNDVKHGRQVCQAQHLLVSHQEDVCSLNLGLDHVQTGDADGQLLL